MTGTQRDPCGALEGFKYPWPFPKQPSTFYKIKSYLTMIFVSSMSRILFAGGNKMVIHNKETFIEALEDESRPLITICNHRSNIDDPLMWASLSWGEFLRNLHRNRYTLAAHNICFSKQWHTTIFSLGRCVPCVRGAGVYQEGMNFSVEKLNENAWIHIFPEGRVTEEPLRFKWGVGRLVMDSEKAPIVIPIWCRNMASVWPLHPPYYPRFGHTVEIFIGKPIDTTFIREKFNESYGTEVQRRKAITDYLQDSLYLMAEKLKQLPPGTAQRIRDLPIDN